jgi:carbon-monoxide dehydrogenase medium subunit
MSYWNHYFLAFSIDEAIQALASAPGKACPVAGGTDLLLEIQQGRHAPVDTLVDVTRIPELTRIQEEDGHLFIGAGAPVCAVTESDLVRRHALAVAEACDLIGGPQVRNTATLGGNVAHALPAADGMIALVALDAQAKIASQDGMRVAPILSLFSGPGETTLKLDREILVGFRIPLNQRNQASAFSRIMRPQGVALPILNMAAWIERDRTQIRDVKIAVGPAGPTPQRAGAVEVFLRNVEYNEANLEGAKALWRTTMRFRTSAMRASADYRFHLAEVLFETVIQTAWQRARGVENE